MEYVLSVSNCCNAPVIENSDMCSKCLEHCEVTPYVKELDKNKMSAEEYTEKFLGAFGIVE